MFVRFVILDKDEDSHCAAGVFQAAYRLRDEGRLDRGVARQLQCLLDWFNGCLPIPERFSLSRGRQSHRGAICWFKDGAVEHLGKIRELTAILEHHGFPTRRLRTERPGYLVYEDLFQVVAVPFRDTPT